MQAIRPVAGVILLYQGQVVCNLCISRLPLNNILGNVLLRQKREHAVRERLPPDQVTVGNTSKAEKQKVKQNEWWRGRARGR